MLLCCRYGNYGHQKLFFLIENGSCTIHAEGCKGVTKYRDTKRSHKDACDLCFDYAGRVALEKQITRMDSVRRMLELCTTTTYTLANITEMKDFLKTTNASTTAQRKALNRSVKAHLEFHQWNQHNKHELETFGVNGSDSADGFLQKFCECYRKSSHFKSGLLMGLVRAVVARIDGYVNARVSQDVIALCQAVHSKISPAYAIMKNNLFGVSERHLQRVQAQERKSCVIDQETTAARVEAWGQRLAAKCEGKVLVSLAIDATKVAPREEISGAFKVMVGGTTPGHALPVNENRRPVQQHDLATEIKCSLLSTQQPVPGITPVCLVAARPQSTNDVAPGYNAKVVAAVKSCKQIRLAAVAVDGLGTESKFVFDGLLDFMRGLDDCVYFIDPNHVAKAIRSQLVLGSSIVTLGRTVVDPGLLMVAGVSQEIYTVKDFASDGLVLKLCSVETLIALQAIMPAEHAGSVVSTGLVLFCVRIFLVGVNSKGDLAAKDRASMIWFALLVVTSLDGVHIITKRNLVTSALGSIFLILQNEVKAPRLCTTEPLEHFFGNVRQVKREFTVRDFIEHVDIAPPPVGGCFGRPRG
eukprot:GHVU01060261.1.p1 GENE.GHVU01060261.1~~GHVU01060261.1.p1  ORF type:complete len:584 (+),score=69.11 GHVU01060261.1:139-1890(+)